MPHKTIAVFTYKGVSRILGDEGTSSWRIDVPHANQYKFAVCTRNARAKEMPGGLELHLSAFIVGKIRDIVPSREVGYEDRFLIRFSEYALVNIPDVWKDRYPVKYTSLEELGIDPATLNWQPMPEPADTPGVPVPPATAAKALTIAEAKEGLATAYGVPPEAIEITIRG